MRSKTLALACSIIIFAFGLTSCRTGSPHTFDENGHLVAQAQENSNVDSQSVLATAAIAVVAASITLICIHGQNCKQQQQQ